MHVCKRVRHVPEPANNSSLTVLEYVCSKEFLDAYMEELRRKSENVRSKATGKDDLSLYVRFVNCCGDACHVDNVQHSSDCKNAHIPPCLCANTAIWKDVIAERHHIHLNATKWVTLTEFVKYLGKEGLAEVDVDEEGKWYPFSPLSPAELCSRCCRDWHDLCRACRRAL